MSGQLSERDFHRLATLVEGHCGIRMPAGKRLLVEGRLRKRVRSLQLADIPAYCRWVLDGDGFAAEFTHLIDAITTNKTDFFREPEHFRFLCERAVPDLLVRRDEAQPLLKLWSAACSCGAEAYTIAMVLADLAARPGPAHRRFRASILGTDICGEVLAEAARAIYPLEMVAPVPPEMRRRYLLSARDPRRREVRIVPELRARTRFARLNLMDGSYPVDRDVDVIFCRNVLIYFDRPTQRAVLDRLSRHLRPGGFLVLGHSESMAGNELALVPVAPTIFRRDAAGR